MGTLEKIEINNQLDARQQDLKRRCRHVAFMRSCFKFKSYVNIYYENVEIFLLGRRKTVENEKALRNAL